MICFINRSTVDYDVRLQKYVQACLETNTQYCVISWNRVKNCTKVYPCEYQYKTYAPYGFGLKNLFPLIGWVVYLWWMLFKLRRQYMVIHACNLENCIMAYPFRLLGKKIVMDIYDSVDIKKESRLAKEIDALILPNNQRLNQIGIKKEEVKRYLEVENVPVFHTNIQIKEEANFSNQIHLAYVGVLQREIRGIENLIKMVQQDNRFILDIAGTGGGLDDQIIAAAADCPRIHYFGKVDYQTALQIMANADFIIALYYLSAKVHEYASPNKYYESLYLATPIITSRNTLVGNNVEKYNTGYTVRDSLDDLKRAFDNVDASSFKDDYSRKKENCRKLWELVYANYFDKQLKKNYIGLMRDISRQ